VPAGEIFELVTAQRYDLIVSPPESGWYQAQMTFHHWITGRVHRNGSGQGILNTRIRVI
jgi:hypothetical protein